jgi:hypothetical protein
VIKLVALFAARRLLRPLVTILIVATLAVMLLSGTRDITAHGSHAVTAVQKVSRPLEQLLQHTLQKAIGP